MCVVLILFSLPPQRCEWTHPTFDVYNLLNNGSCIHYNLVLFWRFLFWICVRPGVIMQSPPSTDGLVLVRQFSPVSWKQLQNSCVWRQEQGVCQASSVHANQNICCVHLAELGLQWKKVKLWPIHLVCLEVCTQIQPQLLLIVYCPSYLFDNFSLVIHIIPTENDQNRQAVAVEWFSVDQVKSPQNIVPEIIYVAHSGQISQMKMALLTNDIPHHCVKMRPRVYLRETQCKWKRSPPEWHHGVIWIGINHENKYVIFWYIQKSHGKVGIVNFGQSVIQIVWFVSCDGNSDLGHDKVHCHGVGESFGHVVPPGQIIGFASSECVAQQVEVCGAVYLEESKFKMILPLGEIRSVFPDAKLVGQGVTVILVQDNVLQQSHLPIEYGDLPTALSYLKAKFNLSIRSRHLWQHRQQLDWSWASHSWVIRYLYIRTPNDGKWVRLGNTRTHQCTSWVKSRQLPIFCGGNVLSFWAFSCP